MAPGRASRSGFTLVELLVVVFIIALLLTVVGLRGGGARERRMLEDEGARLEQLIRLGGEEAVLAARQVGIVFSRDGYHFVLLDGQRWTPTDDQGVLRPRSLPEDIALSLRVEGESLDEGLSDGDGDTPQVLLLSSGETTAFEVELRNTGGEVQLLSVDAWGEIEREWGPGT